MSFIICLHLFAYVFQGLSTISGNARSDNETEGAKGTKGSKELVCRSRALSGRWCAAQDSCAALGGYRAVFVFFIAVKQIFQFFPFDE